MTAGDEGHSSHSTSTGSMWLGRKVVRIHVLSSEFVMKMLSDMGSSPVIRLSHGSMYQGKSRAGLQAVWFGLQDGDTGKGKGDVSCAH